MGSAGVNGGSGASGNGGAGGASGSEKKPSLWERLNQPVGSSGSKADDASRGASERDSGTQGHEAVRKADTATPSGIPVIEKGRPQEPPESEDGLDDTGTLRRPADLSSGAVAPSPAWQPAGGDATVRLGVPAGKPVQAAGGAAGAGQGGGPEDHGGDKGSRKKGHGIDLNKPITLHGGSAALPSKRTMNLYQPVGGTTSGRKTAVVAVVLAVVVVVFVRFAVMGPFQEVQQKQQQLTDAEAQLEPVKEAAADYDEVLAQYQGYTPVSSASGVDATAILELVEQHVKNRATVTQMQLEDTTLTLRVTGVSLQTVGEIAADLGTQQGYGVTSASVSNVASLTGDANDTSNVVANIVCQLQGNVAGDDSTSAADGSGSAGSASSAASTSSSSSTSTSE